MTFQPSLPAAIIVLVALAAAALVVVRLIRSPGSRPIWLLRLALVLACGLLLLRPGIPGGEARTLATEVDVVFVVDTTASIVAEDWDGDRPRLEGVRDDVRAIVAAYPGARFALIGFASDAVVRVPLTTDSRALLSSVEVLRPEVTANSEGTSTTVAAPLLRDMMQAAAKLAPERTRLVFYLGDGEHTAWDGGDSFRGTAPSIAGGAVLGYGTEAGGPMRVTTLGDGPAEYIQYEGERALSVIDLANLEDIAGQLGVGFQHRAAGVPLELPEVPATTTAVDGTTESVAEIGWAIALVIAALLTIELARAVALLLVAARAATRREEAS